MADYDIDADNALPFLVQDGIHRHGRLAGAAVADDQLTLAAADRDHGVDRLDTGLQRFFNRLPVGNARRRIFHRAEFVGLDRSFAVDRLTEGVDYTADHGLAGRNLDNSTGAADDIALFDQGFAPEQNRADGLPLKVEHQAVHAVGIFQQFACHGFFQPDDVCNPVAD